MRTFLWTALLLAVLVILMAVGPCQGTKAVEPLLPQGFLETPLPDVELQGYVYLAPEKPVTIPLGAFREGQPDQGRSSRMEIKTMQLWLGPVVEAVGLSAAFGSAADVREVTAALGERAGLWQQEQGLAVTWVYGTESWSEGLRSALEQGQTARFQDKYPEAWELIRLLPQNPPGKALGVGFIRVDPELLKSIGQNVDLEVESIASALGFVRVERVAFGLYGPESLELPERVTQDYLKEAKLGAVLTAKAGYPGAVVSTLFGSFAERAGMEEIKVGDENFRYRVLNDIHIIAKNIGNTFFFAVAATREEAEALMTSAIAAQLGK